MRYHFNFRSDTTYYPDQEGEELPDLGAALEEARISARELLSLDRGDPDPAFAGGVFEICDAAGVVLAVAHFDENLLGPQPA